MVVYIAPVLLFVVLTIAHRKRFLAFGALDWLPALFVVYVVVSLLLTSDILSVGPSATVKGLVQLVALGPIVYYFLTFGPGISSLRIGSTSPSWLRRLYRQCWPRRGDKSLEPVGRLWLARS